MLRLGRGLRRSGTVLLVSSLDLFPGCRFIKLMQDSETMQDMHMIDGYTVGR